MNLSNNVNNKYFSLCSCTGLRSKELPVIKEFLTIVGSAECVKEGIKKYGYHGDIMVVNHAAPYFPDNQPYQHLVTGHPEFIKPLSELRRKIRSASKFNNFKTHTCGKINQSIKMNLQHIDYLWDFVPRYGSSGGLAIFIGLALGYKKIMLHGIPLNDSQRFHDLEFKRTGTKYYGDMLRLMMKDNFLSKFKGIVRSSSGKTKELLGEPTKEWIET